MSSYVYNSIGRCTTNPPDDQSKWAGFTTGLGSTGNSDNGASYYFVTPIITPSATADPTGLVFFTYGNGATGPNSKAIFKSSNTGWTSIGSVGAGSFTHFVRSVSHGIGVSPLDLNHIAAAGNAGYLMITTNGGASWAEVYLGVTGTDGQNIGWTSYNANVAWASNTLLYVCSESTTVGSAHVAKSSNGGSTWVRADSGLPDVPVTKLVVDPGDATGNTVYAATWLGVYRTTNGAVTWTLFGTGLPQGRVSDLYVAPDSSFIRAATWGRGVWELSAVVGGPSVTSFNPSSGLVGSSVTLTGTGFTGATSVKFNGTSAITFAVVNDTSITATVPAGATTGIISVTTPSGIGTSASSFTVVVTPVLTSFLPTSGPAGTSVTLTGTGFNGATSVNFHGTSASFSVVNDTSITATVPVGATSGTVSPPDSRLARPLNNELHSVGVCGSVTRTR